MSAAIYFAAGEWGWIVTAFVVGSSVLLWQTYRNYPARGWPRWLAAMLKLVALSLLALCLLEPMWSGDSPKKGANDFIVVADNSSRYAIKKDGGDRVGESLAEMLRPEAGGGDPEILKNIAGHFRLRTYQLDRVLKRVGSYEGLDFSSTGSGLVTSLNRLQDRYADRPLAGILLFTDGNVADRELIEQYEGRESGAPVYPVLLKDGADLRDLSLQGVEVSQSAFEDAPVNMAVRILARGWEGQGVVVRVKDSKDKVVATEALRLGAKEEEMIRLKVPSSKAGVSFYKVELSPSPSKKGETPPKEATLENNSRLVAVDRKRGPYRILYVSGRPNWEYKFLRRAVLPDAEIELVGLIRAARREPKFEWRGRTGETSNPLFRGFNSDVPEEAQRYDQPVLVRLNTRDKEELREGFPKTPEELFGEYRAIILDDIEADFFTREQMNLVERFVSTRGGSLLMLGGAESFRQGGYDKTPIGQLLPVYLDRLDDDAGGPVMAARISLTREGRLEPWVRLRENQDKEDTRLAFMPEFHALNRSMAIKPGASMMAVLSEEDVRRFPALVTQRYGSGRSAAYLLGDIWRWGMKAPEMREDMEKSWRQLMRWLVVDTPDLIEFTHELQSIGEGDGVGFSIQVRNKAYQADGEVGVKLSVRQGLGEEGEEAKLYGEPDLDKEGQFTAGFYPREEGAYLAKVEVTDREGAKLGEREVGWVRNSTADELSTLQPDRALLERLAAVTGGRVLGMEEVFDFVSQELPAMETPVTEHWSRPLWHAPWLFAIALMLLVGEWALRRWKGVI